MLNKHFFKTLLMFTAMIAIGLIGVFLFSYFDKSDNQQGVSDVAN